MPILGNITVYDQTSATLDLYGVTFGGSASTAGYLFSQPQQVSVGDAFLVRSGNTYANKLVTLSANGANFSFTATTPTYAISGTTGTGTVTSVTAGTGLLMGSTPGGSVSSSGTLNVNIGASSGQVEGGLGLPAANGYVLASTTSGTRSWVAPATGGGGVPAAHASSHAVGGTDTVFPTPGSGYLSYVGGSYIWDPIAWADLPSVATNTLLGRATAGTGSVETIACTAMARALLDDADAATMRATLGISAAGAVHEHFNVGFYYEPVLTTLDKQPIIVAPTDMLINSVAYYRDAVDYPYTQCTLYLRVNGAISHTIDVTTTSAYKTLITTGITPTTPVSIAANSVISIEVGIAGANNNVKGLNVILYCERNL